MTAARTPRRPLLALAVVVLLLVGLVAAVLYHALNGIRIMLVDFWSKGTKYQKQMSYVVVGLVLTLMVPATYFMIERTVRELFGSAA